MHTFNTEFLSTVWRSYRFNTSIFGIPCDTIQWVSNACPSAVVRFLTRIRSQATRCVKPILCTFHTITAWEMKNVLGADRVQTKIAKRNNIGLIFFEWWYWFWLEIRVKVTWWNLAQLLFPLPFTTAKETLSGAYIKNIVILQSLRPQGDWQEHSSTCISTQRYAKLLQLIIWDQREDRIWKTANIIVHFASLKFHTYFSRHHISRHGTSF